MADLSRVCPELEGFERLIAENGAVIHSPADRRTRTLCPRLPERFINELRARGVAPLGLDLWRDKDGRLEIPLEALRELVSRGSDDDTNTGID